MELKDTIGMMLDDDYKERFKAEYHQLKIRFIKLHKVIVMAEVNVLPFTLTCPLDLLREQREHMKSYLQCLEVRAKIENIEL